MGSGRSGATGDCAVPHAEVECQPGAGLLRRKQSTAANSAKDPPRMRNIATKSPAPSTANGASGLPGQSAMLSMGMETSTARGCTLSQPCLEAKNVKEMPNKQKPATTPRDQQAREPSGKQSLIQPIERQILVVSIA